MAALNCELSPLVFVELYRLLGKRRDLHEGLEERLSVLGLGGLAWLSEAMETYDERWRADLTWIAPDSVAGSVVQYENALLASWLLAGLRHAGPSQDFSSELRRAVAMRALQEVDGLQSPFPAPLTPSVIGWTLGMVVGAVDASFPVLPATLLGDPELDAAYQGLIEHLIVLDGDTEQVPELVASATYIRSAGLAEALAGNDADGLRRAIEKLLLDSRLLAPQEVLTRIQRNWDSRFVDRRNVLTHLRLDQGELTFTTAAAHVSALDHIRVMLEGITQFVCQAVSARLAEVRPRELQGNPWEGYLRRNLTR